MTLQERMKMWKEREDFKNSLKKGAMVGLAGVALFGGMTVPAQASGSVQSTNIHMEYTHSRPLIGNIRGSSLVLPRNHQNSGVRVRVTIGNWNNNGQFISTTTSGWRTETSLNNNHAVTRGVGTGTIVGVSRFGAVSTYGERRALGTNTWNGRLTRLRTWWP